MDNSFFRFLNDFEQAKDLQNSNLSELNYDMQIHLSPKDKYSCITNVPEGIAFDSQYRAYIVDCSNTVIGEVTDRVIISEFTHSKTGKQQLKLEIISLELDCYTDLVYLRLDHDVPGGDSFWTNPFLVSEYDLNETTEFAFKHNSVLDGTDYKTANIFQVIRLKCFRQKTSFANSQQSYTTISGLKYSSRLIKTKFYEYIFDMCNDFIYDRLQFLLSHDIIYVNGIRVTDKQTFDNADKISDTTNVSQNKFKLAVNEDDIYDYGYQVYEYFELDVVSKIPSGNYSKTGFSTATVSETFFELVFNKEIQISDDAEIKVYKNNVLIHTFNKPEISVSGNKLLVDITGILLSDFGVYNILINNTVKSHELIVEEFEGLTTSEWTYTVVDGLFNKLYFNGSYFNTNNT